jgi:hypothetical protein
VTSISHSPAIWRPRAFLRQLGVGRWIYRHGFNRLARHRWLLQFGAAGAVRYVLGESAMRRAAPRLSPVEAGDPEGFACTFMTGRFYWHQTLFCVVSLARCLDAPLRVTLVDDGTLSPRQTTALRTVLRGVHIVGPAEIAARLDSALPRGRFPLLRSLRDTMPMMRKLVDLRAGRSGWQLYLDSDMLFFGRPDFLVDCALHRQACHMHDRVHGYAVSDAELHRRTGVQIRPGVNAGIVGFDDSLIDWDLVERWLNALPPSALNSHLIEQTLTALLLTLHDAVRAPDEHYHILYDSESAAPDGARLLHYIFHAKLRYFTRDWRRLPSSGPHLT